MNDVWRREITNLNTLFNMDKAMRAGLAAVLAAQKRRIFQFGEDAINIKIGRYSTKPASISKKQQAVNTGKTYFKGGYAEYKSLIGKNPGYVILRNTDQMMMDYSMFVLSPTQYGLGFSNQFNFDKSEWMEAKYKKAIFDEAPQEGRLLENVIDTYFERNL